MTPNAPTSVIQYLNRSTQGLPSRARERARKELMGDLRERVAELQAHGVVEGDAWQRAMTEFGAPTDTARGLRRVHLWPQVNTATLLLTCLGVAAVLVWRPPPVQLTLPVADVTLTLHCDPQADSCVAYDDGRVDLTQIGRMLQQQGATLDRVAGIGPSAIWKVTWKRGRYTASFMASAAIEPGAPVGSGHGQLTSATSWLQNVIRTSTVPVIIRRPLTSPEVDIAPLQLRLSQPLSLGAIVKDGLQSQLRRPLHLVPAGEGPRTVTVRGEAGDVLAFISADAATRSWPVVLYQLAASGRTTVPVPFRVDTVVDDLSTVPDRGARLLVINFGSSLTFSTGKLTGGHLLGEVDLK